MSEKREGFTVIPNSIIQNKSLSSGAKSLLILMLSLPDDWKFSVSGLVAVCGESLYFVRKHLQELKSLGYLEIRKTYPSGDRKNIVYDYRICENPQITKSQDIEFQTVENQTVENQTVENRTLQKKKKQNKNNKINNTKTVTDDRLKKAMSDLENVRKKNNKPVHNGIRRLIIQDLNNLSSDIDEQIKIVEQSVREGWCGVYPLKDSPPSSFLTPTSNSKEIEERFIQLQGNT